tara:strand:- start:1056 stop:1295 length:240 start_codon:yes stop_codon:yes gene_type:complete
MSRLPLSTELALVALVLLFPLFMMDPMENLAVSLTVMLTQMAACIGSFVARHYERKAQRAYIQGIIDKVKKKRENDQAD